MQFNIHLKLQKLIFANIKILFFKKFSLSVFLKLNSSYKSFSSFSKDSFVLFISSNKFVPFNKVNCSSE